MSRPAPPSALPSNPLNIPPYQPRVTELARQAVSMVETYELGSRALERARADGDEIRCHHCDQVIAADERLHVHADGGLARPVCDRCDAMEGDR